MTLIGVVWQLQNYNYKLSDAGKSKLALGVEMVDNNNKPILHAVNFYNNKFKGNFMIRAAANQDTLFDVILINNFKQVDFSINGSKEQKKHSLLIPKANDGNYYSTLFKISFDNIQGGLNDSVLILIRKMAEKELDVVPKRRTFATRFAFYNESIVEKLNPTYTSDYQVVKGELAHNILLFEKPFKEIAGNHYENFKTISTIDKIKVGDIIKLYACINIKKSTEGSPFFDDYLKDEKHNVRQTYAIIALLDGELYPTSWENSEDKIVKFYDVELGKTILVSPELTVTESGVHDFSLLVLCYPFADPETLLSSYKMSNWSTIIYSDILVNVNE